MMFHRLAATKEGQRGFTLVELLVVIAITGVIGSVVVGAIYQVFTVSSRNTSRMTIVKQLENAVRWITPDAQMAMADNVSGDLAEAGGLSLTWKERDGTVNNVIYRIQIGQLQRIYSRNGALQSTKVVARNIDLAHTSSDTSRVIPLISDALSFHEDTKRISGGTSLGSFIEDDIILVTGSTSNDGYYTVVDGGDSWIEVTETLVNESAGDSVTIRMVPGTIAFTVTSAIGGYKPESVTRSFNVTLRSS